MFEFFSIELFISVFFAKLGYSILVYVRPSIWLTQIAFPQGRSKADAIHQHKLFKRGEELLKKPEKAGILFIFL